MFANLAGHAAGDETAHEQDERIETDVGLRDWRWSARPRRYPTKGNGCGEVGKSGGDARETADPRVETQNRKDDENEEEQRGGAGQGTISRGKVGCQPGDSDRGHRRFESRASEPEEARKFLILAQCAVDQVEHRVLIKAERRGQSEIPCDMRAEDGGV